jgi:hypothetical protein
MVKGCGLKGSYHLVDLGIDGMIILKWILNKWGFEVMDRSYRYSNKPLIL